ncbi:hypothetical protein GALMADRAFT_162246, partial [Galerina marginata CBS 339.88]
MFVVNGVVVPQRGERRVAACVEGVNDVGAGSSRGAYIRLKSNVGRGQTRSGAKAKGLVSIRIRRKEVGVRGRPPAQPRRIELTPDPLAFDVQPWFGFLATSTSPSQ